MNKNDDLWYALANNNPTKFLPDDITDIILEVIGANDELAWWWVLSLKNGKYVLLSASCDYTGWDCQSSINYEEIFDTIQQAVEASPEKEETYSGRYIRKNLLGQFTGKYPKYTYCDWD